VCLELLQDPRLYDHLLRIDRELAQRARNDGCPRCDGCLHSADYPRKPRGGRPLLDAVYHLRLSFCCALCRKRLTPPSVRFLGRRVFYGAVVVLSCQQTLTSERIKSLAKQLGVDRRTLRRWCRWWRQALVQLPWWQLAQGRFSPVLDHAQLPGSLVARFSGALEDQLVAVLRFLSPLSTAFSVMGIDYPQKLHIAAAKMTP